MARLLQPWLPEVKGVEKIVKERKTPEPQIGKYQAIKKFELLHHPFDLKFRGRLNKWLVRLEKNKNIKFRSLVDYNGSRIFRLYLFPQKPNGVWLTQKQVAKIMKKPSTRKFRKQLVTVLLTLWDETRVVNTS